MILPITIDVEKMTMLAQLEKEIRKMSEEDVEKVKNFVAKLKTERVAEGKNTIKNFEKTI